MGFNAFFVSPPAGVMGKMPVLGIGVRNADDEAEDAQGFLVPNGKAG